MDVAAAYFPRHAGLPELHAPLRRDMFIAELQRDEATTLLASLRAAAIHAEVAGAAIAVRARRNRMFKLADVIEVVREALPSTRARVSYASPKDGARDSRASR
jgi:hypothetical protein